MSTLIFDIETGPLPREVILDRVGPYPEFVKRDFDPGSVKFGNTKDPAKMRQKIHEARAKHELARDEWVEGRVAWENAAVEKAALSPVTGQVVAIGYWEMAEVTGGCCISGVNDAMDERQIIREFWSRCLSYDRIIGHNIFGFDLPFLIRRSWMLGVDVPPNILDKDRYWNAVFVDTMVKWGCGSRDYVSLDTLARICGHPGKTGSGADFARLWSGTPQERAEAARYLENDLEMTLRVAEMMGLV